MRIKLINYKQGNRVVSVAKNDAVKADLLQSGLDFLFIANSKAVLYPTMEVLDIAQKEYAKLLSCNDYDVCTLWSDGTLYRCYDDSSLDNFFFVTSHCNSNCIMCPSPEFTRKKGESMRAEELIEIARHIPDDTKHLTITGGEPFMIGKQIFDFIGFLSRKFYNTEFLILTNGRIFSITTYVELLKKTISANTTLGIPLHGSTEAVHDAITQTRGSFLQTTVGLRKLLCEKIKIELRLVVNRLNADDFYNMAKLIVNEFAEIDHVSIMAMEMTGNAFVNKGSVWISYRESFEKIEQSILLLIKNGIDVRLFNFPLCTVKAKYWTLCEKSISSDKIRYNSKCNDCVVRDACGGIFAGTYNMEKDELVTQI